MLPNDAAIDRPMPASAARVAKDTAPEAITTQPESTSSAPISRYWRKLYTPANAAPTGKADWIALAAKVMAVRRPRRAATCPARIRTLSTEANAT